MIYKSVIDQITGNPANIVMRFDGLFIPFDPANTDYANFKKDLANGAELLDSEGNVIDGIAYLEELA